jgi:hypothetical protein
MGDLQLSAAVLDELRGALRSMTTKLEGACRELRGVDATSMGAAPLVGGVANFTSEWNYGITQVGQHATQAAGMLDHIGKAFAATERQITDELRRGPGGAR